jgi:Tfp pilus assembly protein PilE
MGGVFLKMVLNPRVLVILVAILALWWAYSYVHELGYKEAEAELTPRIAALEKARDDAKAVAMATDKEYRAKEEEWTKALKEKQDEYNAQQADNANRLAKVQADADRNRASNEQLRSALASYAAGSGSPTPDTLAAASSRAVALGGLLEECYSLADEAVYATAKNASAAESNGDGVRTLLASWPH